MKQLAGTSIKFLKGVGEVRAQRLATPEGIYTLRDLLYTFPLRFVDRSRFTPVAEFAADGAYVQVLGSFISFRKEGEGARRRLIGLFTDGTMLMEAVWFSSIARLEKLYRTGTRYVLFGKPSQFNGSWSMVHPEVDEFNAEAQREPFHAVYSIAEKARKAGLTQRLLRQWAFGALLTLRDRDLADILPARLVEDMGLMPLKQALRAMHFPRSAEELAGARRRFKFEELYYIQLHLLGRSRLRATANGGRPMPRVGEAFNTFYRKVLPFPLTGAQKRVIHEIRADLLTGMQMNRLLQGDVGSGKTLVAFMAMLLAIDNGTQALLMAPTEILATQHFQSLAEWGRPLGVEVRLLTGSTTARERRFLLPAIADGTVDILVGTHALIEDTVTFATLGMAVIDEQHRFGVEQRARLWRKSSIAPHVLVMTATPIPRTLAMTLYGDLDVSVINELPPGRKPVATSLAMARDKEQVWRLVNDQLRQGRQVYVVYPLIQESEKLDLKSLEEGLRAVTRIFGDTYAIAYVHGQMKPGEKEAQMDRFVGGEARILVSTTVIEVGVNVPNASVMVIENAERFGLSQLHQLRGRVGRGADRSYCVLVAGDKKIGDTARRRLELMTQTNDGFEIAEADMNTRGPGDLDGTMQSGLPFNLKVASLARDGDLLSLARRKAAETLEKYPALPAMLDKGAMPADTTAEERGTMLMLASELTLRFGNTHDWSQIS